MQIGSQYLFPLILIDSRLTSYYLDAEGSVYSTRQTGVPKKLLGSRSSYSRYYTLAGSTHEAGTLFRRAKQHIEFVKHTTKPSAVDAIKAAAKTSSKISAARSHAESVAQGIAKRGWVIGKVASHDGALHLQFGSKPAIHLTEQSYTSELSRLAQEHPGTQFVAVRIEKAVVAGGLAWS